MYKEVLICVDSLKTELFKSRITKTPNLTPTFAHGSYRVFVVFR